MAVAEIEKFTGSEQADTRRPARLPAEMAPGDPDRARALLDAMLGGMMESWLP